MKFINRLGSDLAYFAALIFALAFVAFDSHWRVHQIEAATKFARSVATDAGPLTTRDLKERLVVLPTASMDARWWIIHTEQMLKAGDWRVRDTPLDNAPAGREVHWSSLPMWILAGLGGIIGHFQHVEAGESVQWAALYFGPVTFMAVLISFSLVIYRIYGGVSAAVFCLACIGTFPLFQFFRAGEADHHGLVSACSLASVLSLLIGGMGCVGALPPQRKKSRQADRLEVGWPDERTARLWFVASGFAGAAGLWISSASQIPVLAGCGVSALFVAALSARSKTCETEPVLWRIWGISGGLASLGFYLLEYFPYHIGLRLEVNNPVYAMAWVGAGIILEHLTRWFSRKGRLCEGTGDLLIFSLALIAAGTPILMILLGQKDFFWVSDRFLFDLHREYIREFQGLWDYLASQGGMSFALSFLPLSLLGLGAAGLALYFRCFSERRLREIAFALCPALVVQAMAVSQVRWGGNAAALWIVLVTVVAGALVESRAISSWWKWSAAAVFLFIISLYPAESIRVSAESSRQKGVVDREFLPSILTLDIAQRINRSFSGRQPVILSGPTSSTELAYFGGAKVLGTLYWENRPGLRAASDIYSATDERELKRLLEARGVTHLVIFSWDSFAQSYVRLHRALARTAEARDGCIAGLLEGTRPQPVWLRPLYYSVPKSYGLEKTWVRIYQFAPDQTPAEWHYYVGMYQVDAGRLDLAAESFRRARELNPDGLDSAAALAIVLLQNGKPEEGIKAAESLLKTGRKETPALVETVAAQTAKSGKAAPAKVLYGILAEYFRQNGRETEAERMEKAASQLGP